MFNLQKCLSCLLFSQHMHMPAYIPAKQDYIYTPMYISLPRYIKHVCACRPLIQDLSPTNNETDCIDGNKSFLSKQGHRLYLHPYVAEELSCRPARSSDFICALAESIAKSLPDWATIMSRVKGNASGSVVMAAHWCPHCCS